MKKFLLFFLGLFIIFCLFYPKKMKNLKKIKIGNALILVEIADNPKKREKGLSGRNFLPQNQGMLFIFEKPDYWSFWMKDMKFPLDFVWIRGNKIVEITENVKVEDFQPPNLLRPKKPVDKVLELNSGMVKKLKIKPNDLLLFY